MRKKETEKKKGRKIARGIEVNKDRQNKTNAKKNQ